MDRPSSRPVDPDPEDGDALRKRRLQRLAIAGGAAAFAIIAGLSAFGPIARARIAKEAEKRKLDITVDSVRPGFFAVSLKGVTVKPRGVEGVKLALEDVRVDLSAGLSVREVVAHGGIITIDGEPEDVVQRLKDFKKSGGGGAEAAESAKGGKRMPVTVDGVGLAWHVPSAGTLEASGIGLSRSSAGVVRATCTQFAAKHGTLTVAFEGGEVETDDTGALKRIASNTMRFEQAPAPEKKPIAAPVASAEEAPPPLPTQARSKAKAKVAGKAVPPPGTPSVEAEPVLPLPDLHALRARIAAMTTSLGGRVPDGTKIDIGGLAVKLDVGGEPFAFGPGPFALERRGDRVHLSFTSEQKDAKKDAAGGTPLSLDADLPLGAGDVVARLSGGPVSLAMLGVKEGTRGLSDVQRGTVSGKGQIVLAAAGDALTFDGKLALKSIAIHRPKVSADPLKNLELAVAARGNLDDTGRLRIDHAELDMGALHVKTHGNIEETREHFAASLSVDVSPAACQALLDSAPRGLLPIMQQVRMNGTFGAEGRVVFDSRTVDKLTLEYTVDDRCKVVEVPRELSKDRFNGSFTYRTYKPDPKGGMVASETTTGPGTSSWTNIDDISPFMIAAVLTTEDGAFYKHHGFNHAAIKNSVAANLKAKRFVRGASTITMQLAKNLFLSREKTLSRKIEEVLLTDYLEQIFRKEDMMELYLNVIEFGPDVYGITRAADYYFGRKPEELNLAESFFLASLLPSPIRYGRQKEKGQVSETWGRHLRALMEIAAKNGKVSQAELADGLAANVTFVKPGDPRPEARKPVRGGHKDGTSDDTGWQPLE